MKTFTILGTGWLGFELAKVLKSKYKIKVSSRNIEKQKIYEEEGFASCILNENNLDFLDELLTYGLANYLEVLTSKNDALNAELSLVDNKFQQYKAIIQLYRALGGGWQ